MTRKKRTPRPVEVFRNPNPMHLQEAAVAEARGIMLARAFRGLAELNREFSTPWIVRPRP